ncbi:hypothetical protein NL676_010976 [Syzygium grande]|nr:hypothetical protein NL676_010976 [Syzygium grande]
MAQPEIATSSAPRTRKRSPSTPQPSPFQQPEHRQDMWTRPVLLVQDRKLPSSPFRHGTLPPPPTPARAFPSDLTAADATPPRASKVIFDCPTLRVWSRGRFRFGDPTGTLELLLNLSFGRAPKKKSSDVRCRSFPNLDPLKRRALKRVSEREEKAKKTKKKKKKKKGKKKRETEKRTGTVAVSFGPH